MSDNLLEYQLFPVEYFSGCDVSVYFGNDWVDEISNLTFAIFEHVQPIYGYNSLVYDDIARGTRIIQGSFQLNFKEVGYLKSILRQFEEKQHSGRAFMAHPKDRVSAVPIAFIPEKDQDLISTFQNASPEEKAQLQRQLEAIAYGSRQRIGEEESLRREYFFNESSKGFNIILTYGIPKSGIMNAGRFHKIVGVQLTSCTQVISSDGSPVFENYEFLARDIN
jgi:hypothetical protein